MANKTDMVTKKVETLTEVMAQKYQMNWESFLNTFKASLFKSLKREATNEEVAMMMLVCKQYDLNPFVGQIFAFPAKNGSIVPVVGIDGFTTIAERNDTNDGFEMSESSDLIQIDDDAKPCPKWMEVKIYRKGQTHPTVVREYLDEVYVPTSKKGFVGPWQTHTKRMLRHKTLIQGYRLAYAITGIYDEDEAHRIDEAVVTEIKAKPSFIPYPDETKQIDIQPDPIDVKPQAGEKPKVEEVKPIDPPAPEQVDVKPKEEVKPKVDKKDLCTKEQINQIVDLLNSCEDMIGMSEKMCKAYKVELYTELTKAQAQEAIRTLIDKYNAGLKKEGKK